MSEPMKPDKALEEQARAYAKWNTKLVEQTERVESHYLAGAKSQQHLRDENALLRSKLAKAIEQRNEEINGRMFGGVDARTQYIEERDAQLQSETPERGLMIPDYPIEVEWVYHDNGKHKTGMKGIMYSWGIIQWQGDETFSYYGNHIFKVTDERVKEFLK